MSETRLIVKGGTVVDPAGGVPRPGDLIIDDDRIAGIAPPGSVPAEGTVIDATGMLVLPGLVDMHVHLREPGQEYKETIATGTAAAVAGGITSVACMANTNPVNDSGAVTRFILEQAAHANTARVYPVGALSLGLKGEQLAEFGEMRRAGIVAVSDDGRPVMDAGLMRRALEYARMFDLLVIAHEEDCGLANGGVMNEGVTAVRLGLRGIPAAAEEVMVARDVALAELTGGRLHIAHLSTRGAVDLVRAAKARGVSVSAEATPHHLLLTDEAVGDYDTHAKMAPPLRTRADVDAVRAGLADGTIEALATDHAPHHRDEKELEFEHAANGIVGLETSLALGLKLVAGRRARSAGAGGTHEHGSGAPAARAGWDAAARRAGRRDHRRPEAQVGGRSVHVSIEGTQYAVRRLGADGKGGDGLGGGTHGLHGTAAQAVLRVAS
jgi:dihydroorotase